MLKRFKAGLSARPMRIADIGTAEGLTVDPRMIALNLAFAAVAAVALWPLWTWAVTDAVWSGVKALCRTPGAGACWIYVSEKLRFFLFGFYPVDQQWRPLLATAILLGLAAISVWPKFWRLGLLVGWSVGIVAFLWLMGGGAGLRVVSTAQWSGLPLTVMLAVFGLMLGFPLGIILALGRRSDLPVIRYCCIGWIEVVRGVPFITILFMSNVLLPFLVPGGVDLNKLVRVQIGFAIFASAYIAEVVRGGLQAIPKGQKEAAEALGLGSMLTNCLVIIPQALRIAVPALVNTAIALFKDTSLVVVIGLFDLLGTVRAASKDREWLGFAAEGYLTAALIYFLFCFAFSKAGSALERRHSPEANSRQSDAPKGTESPTKEAGFSC